MPSGTDPRDRPGGRKLAFRRSRFDNRPRRGEVFTLDPRPTGAPEPPVTRRGRDDDSFAPVVRRGLRDRDPEAVAAFYDSYFDRLYGFVRRMVGEDHLAEDLTQDIFMHVVANFESYDPERALRPWVLPVLCLCAS